MGNADIGQCHPVAAGYPPGRRHRRRRSLAAPARSSRPPPPAPAAAGAPAQLGQLTEREREIVALVAEGLTNDEIANRLIISPMTVKTHVNRSMTKLDLRDRAQLVVAAYQSGLVRVGPND